MRWLLLGLLAAVAGTALALLISADSGYILISIGSYTLEMSFWFGLLAFFLALYLLKSLVSLFARFRDALAGSVGWISESRAKRIVRRTNTGLIYFVEGNWRAAKKELLAAAKLEKKPLLQYLAAANSAFELGEEEETRFLLHQAEKVAPENQLAIMLTQARIEIRNKKYEHALATLERAAAISSDDPVVLKLQKIVNEKLEAWSSLLTLLPKLKASKSFSKEELLELEVKAWEGQLDLALTKAMEMNSEPLPSFERIWKGMPSEIRKTSSVVALFTRKLLIASFHDKALETLVSALKHNWNSSLLFLYGMAEGSDIKQQLLQAETWLRDHPGDAELLYVLGKLARTSELWGKAQEYLEKSLMLKPAAYTYAELASLLAHLGKHKESADCYRKGLTHLSS